MKVLRHAAVGLRLLSALALSLPACAVEPLSATAAAQGGDAHDADLFVQAMRALSDGRRAHAAAIAERMANGNLENASEWLDLAMVHCAIGNAEQARRLFAAIEERFDPPPGIRELISQQRLQGCRKPAARSQLSIAFGRGVDRNVNQGASNPSFSLGGTGGATLELQPEFLPQRDQYSVLTGNYSREASEHGTVAFAQASLRRNDRLEAYDTASLFGGIEQPWHVGNWKLRATGFGGALTLGGRLYQQQAQLQFKVIPPLPLPKGTEASLMAGRAHVNYTTLENFDANTDELRLALTRRSSDAQWALNTGGQRDHAIGTRPGGDRHGWSIGASAYRRLGGNWQGELDLSRQVWQGETVYASEVIDLVRRQDTRVARAALVYLVSEHQSVQLEARRVRNKENISIFDYHNTIWQLSWQWNGL